MHLEAIGPDEKEATLIKAVAGDVLRIHKGTVVRFTSPSHGKGTSSSSLSLLFRIYLMIRQHSTWARGHSMIGD